MGFESKLKIRKERRKRKGGGGRRKRKEKREVKEGKENVKCTLVAKSVP